MKMIHKSLQLMKRVLSVNSPFRDFTLPILFLTRIIYLFIFSHQNTLCCTFFLFFFFHLYAKSLFCIFINIF